MEKDVTDIFEKLGSPEGFLGFVGLLYANRVERFFFVLSHISFVLFMAAYALPATRAYSVYLLIGVFLCILVYTVSSFLGFPKYLIKPTRAYFSGLGRRLGGERGMVRELAVYEAASIRLARERLEFERSDLEARMGFLLGVVDKFGVAPVLIALYLAYAALLGDPGLKQVPVSVLVFIAALYWAAFLAKNVTSKLSAMLLLLGQAQALSEGRGPSGAEDRPVQSG